MVLSMRASRNSTLATRCREVNHDRGRMARISHDKLQRVSPPFKPDVGEIADAGGVRVVAVTKHGDIDQVRRRRILPDLGDRRARGRSSRQASGQPGRHRHRQRSAGNRRCICTCPVSADCPRSPPSRASRRGRLGTEETAGPDDHRPRQSGSTAHDQEILSPSPIAAPVRHRYLAGNADAQPMATVSAAFPCKSANPSAQQRGTTPTKITLAPLIHPAFPFENDQASQRLALNPHKPRHHRRTQTTPRFPPSRLFGRLPPCIRSRLRTAGVRKPLTIPAVRRQAANLSGSEPTRPCAAGLAGLQMPTGSPQVG